MYIEENLALIKNLYENIFGESVDNSKEFLNFANGNPHPLRQKLEDWLLREKDVEEDPYNLKHHSSINQLHAHVARINAAFELDYIITNYIEENE